MKANELRIGNIILVHGQLRVISEVSNVEAVLCEGAIHANLDKGYAEPIPLTEEWLVKFGFKNGFLKVGEQYINIELNYDSYSLMGADSCTSGQSFSGSCKYVHQLQNLYFALTGEELILK